MADHEQLEKRIIYLENVLENLIGSDRYTIQKTIQMFDERNFQLGKNKGTKFGTETSQLLSFYGVTTVNQPEAVPEPTGGSTIDSQARGAINDIRSRLIELGLTA